MAGHWNELSFKVPANPVCKETLKGAFPWPGLAQLSVLLQ